MTITKYMDTIHKVLPNEKRVKAVEEKYRFTLPPEVQRIVSVNQVSTFLDGGQRVLSYNEIIDAENDLDVNFSELGVIPLIDFGDNDFLVYHNKDGRWSLFNIVDQVSFKSRPSLLDVFR